MSFRLTRIGVSLSLVALMTAAAGTMLAAQNTSSFKAYVAAGTSEEVLVQGAAPVKILEGWAKTSTVGDLMVGVSLECALWTGTSNTAQKGGGKTTSTSRAAVNVTVVVGGVEAVPGQVVYCDREQQVNLEFSSLDVVLTDAITLELFLKTKNANHFNFYTRNPGNATHHVEVWASGVIDDATAAVGATRAAIGKRTMVIEEFNSSN